MSGFFLFSLLATLNIALYNRSKNSELWFYYYIIIKLKGNDKHFKIQSTPEACNTHSVKIASLPLVT